MSALDRTDVSRLVFAAVDEVNKLLRRAQRLQKSPDTVIGSDGSGLDSLGLVNLIFTLEQLIEQEYGVPIALAEESALSREPGPFHTLGTLTDHIHDLLEKKLHG